MSQVPRVARSTVSPAAHKRTHDLASYILQPKPRHPVLRYALSVLLRVLWLRSTFQSYR